MIKGPRHIKVIVGILLMLVPYWISMYLVFTGGPMGRSKVATMTFLVIIGISIEWGLVLWGVWRKQYWAGGKFLSLFLVHNLKMIILLIHLSKEIPLFFLTAPLALFFAYYSLFNLAKIDKDYWKPKPRWWKRFFRIDTIPNFFLLFCILEMALGISGLEAGEVFPRNYFQRVDSLIIKTDYSNDDDGIMVINETGQKLAATGYWDGEFKKAYGRDSIFSGSVHSVYLHYEDLRLEKEETAYSKMVDSLKSLPDSIQTEVDKAYIQTLIRPINDDGYRSIAFKPLETEKKKILLLGDSFTFGWSAEEWTNAFADLLATKGYVVYNGGITGTDPQQYLAVAQKYIPLLKPDYVIVNPYLGNDIVYYHREVKKEQPIYFVTNAGVLSACPTEECFPDARTAYEFYLLESYLGVDKDATRFERFAGKSILGTALWRGLNHLGLTARVNLNPHASYWKENKKKKSERPLTEEYLMGIKDVCGDFGAEFLCCIIPNHTNVQPDMESDFPDLFEELEVHIPVLEKDDYRSAVTDGHYNNKGHIVHANLIDSLIRKKAP